MEGVRSSRAVRREQSVRHESTRSGLAEVNFVDGSRVTNTLSKRPPSVAALVL